MEWVWGGARMGLGWGLDGVWMRSRWGWGWDRVETGAGMGLGEKLDIVRAGYPIG